MKQMTLARGGFERFGKTTKRAVFLAEMNQVIPWSELCALIEPHYSKAGGPGRPPVGLERMLRIHFLQHWFNLSDRAVEEALYESLSMREFAGIDLGHGELVHVGKPVLFQELEGAAPGRELLDANERLVADGHDGVQGRTLPGRARRHGHAPAGCRGRDVGPAGPGNHAADHDLRRQPADGRRGSAHGGPYRGARRPVFLATLAHELRNPLAPIVNTIGLLARINSGKIELRHELVDLREVLRTAAETSQPPH